MNMRIFATLLAGSLALGCSESSAPDPIATVTVSATNSTLTAVGATVQLTASAMTAGGKTRSSAAFFWMSTAPGVATVSATGLVTAVGNGSTAINASVDGVMGSVVVTVSQQVASITITPGAVPTITALGATTALTAAPVDANNNPVVGATISWTTTAAGVATVSGAGVVTSVGNGTTTISATAQGVTATRSVTVAQAIAAVVIAPGTLAPIDALTATTALTATVRDSRSINIAGATVAWSSTVPAVATVSASGTLTSVANGTTRIIASSGGFSDTLLVTVAQVGTVADIFCVNYNNLISVGATVQCSAEMRDRLNRVMTATFTWSVNNPNIATVTNNGVVAAVDNGDVVVSATSGLLSATQLVRVDLAIPLGSVRNGRVRAAGYAQQWDVTGGGTRASFATWVYRSPLGSSTLDPTINFVTTSSGVQTSRFSAAALPWLVGTGADLYARADMPNSTANTDLYVGGGSTAGEYVLGVSDCRIPFGDLPLGYYNRGQVLSSDCAILQSTLGGVVFAAATTGIVMATAGQSVVIEVIGDCAACGSGRLPDPVLYVFGPEDSQVWFNDDGVGTTLNSRIAFTAPSTGDYTVLITDNGGRFGTYTICSFSGCTAYAPPALTAGLQDGSAEGPVRVRMPSLPTDGWRSSLTVEKAYEALKALGMLPPGFDPRQTIPPRKIR